MTSIPPTVFLVDDDPSHLTSMTRMLRASGFQTLAFSSAAAFLQNCPPDSPGCVVADLRMPGVNGMELQDLIAKSDNPLPVIFLTGNGDIPTSVDAMRQGAEDFLTKSAPKERLLDAVRRALERDACDREMRDRRRELRARFDRLTSREGEVLTHVLSGQLNKQIAADLGIDERSVKRHRTHLMHKLQVQSVAELAQLAVEARWNRRQ